MNQTTLPQKALGAFSALFLLAVATSPFWTLMIIKGHAGRIANDTLPSLISTSLASASMSEAFLETTLAIAAQDPQAQAENLNRIAAQTKKTDEELAAYAALIDDDVDRRNYDQLVENRRRYRATRDNVVALLNEGRRAEAIRLFNDKGLEQFRAYIASLNQLREYTISEAGQRGHQIMRWCNFLLVVQGVLLVYFFIYGFFVPLLAVLEKLTTKPRVLEDI